MTIFVACNVIETYHTEDSDYHYTRNVVSTLDSSGNTSVTGGASGGGTATGRETHDIDDREYFYGDPYTYHGDDSYSYAGNWSETGAPGSVTRTVTGNSNQTDHYNETFLGSVTSTSYSHMATVPGFAADG